MFKGNRELPEDPASSPAEPRRKEDGQSSSRRDWHSADLAQNGTSTSLPMPSIFRELIPVLCWKLSPGPEQPGGRDLLHMGSICGVGSAPLEFMAQSDNRDMLSLLSSCPRPHQPLKWHGEATAQWEGHDLGP